MTSSANTLATTPTRADAQAAGTHSKRRERPGRRRSASALDRGAEAYFRDMTRSRGCPTGSLQCRDDGWRKAIQRLRGAAYYALTLQASARKRPHLRQPDQIRGASGKLFEQNPQHPGVTPTSFTPTTLHRLPKRNCLGTALCRHAPAVPHARHMPSHIYSMVGLWEESIASNASALEIQPDYYHASDLPSMHICSSHRCQSRCDDPKVAATATAAIVRSASPISPPRPLCRRAMSWNGGLASAAALPMTPTQYPMRIR